MKVTLSLLIFTLFSSLFINAQSSCGSPLTLADGACFNGAMPGSINMSGLCIGGNNPTIFIRFTAGSCSQFTIIPSVGGGRLGARFYTVGCGAGVGGAAGYNCENPVIAGAPIILDGMNGNAAGATTPFVSGTDYILQVWGTGGSLSICYNANTPEAANNECAGASGLSPAGSTYNNSGNCAYTGSLNDATTSDPAPGALCAGSLENTQWVRFQPQPGATSFQIIVSGAVCTGPVCAWQFGILSGSCGALTAEGCAGNGTYCSSGPDGASIATGSTADGFALSWSGYSATGVTATITRTGGGTFTGTENFYLVMDGNANSDCKYNLTGINIQPLPIELIAFYAVKYSNANKLTWEVASEKNNHRFEIERSLDGLNWITVSVIGGAGTSNTQRVYATLDQRFDKAVNYYRLAQYDYDGTVNYSRIISVDNEDFTKEIVAIYNLMGQEVDMGYNGIKVVTYSDGSTEKKY